MIAIPARVQATSSFVMSGDRRNKAIAPYEVRPDFQHPIRLQRVGRNRFIAPLADSRSRLFGRDRNSCPISSNVELCNERRAAQ
jgi:hypothetical protein